MPCRILDKLYTASAWETPAGETVDVRDLIDGTGNDVKKVAEKILQVIKLLRKNLAVTIQCSAGISRSNAIAIAVVSLVKGKSFEEAIRLVRERCKRAFPNAGILSDVWTALIYIQKTRSKNLKS